MEAGRCVDGKVDGRVRVVWGRSEFVEIRLLEEVSAKRQRDGVRMGRGRTGFNTVEEKAVRTS